MSKFTDAGHAFVPTMTKDAYYPPALVAKIRELLEQLVAYLEERPRDLDDVQRRCDELTVAINAIGEEMGAAGSDLETVARDDIAETVISMFKVYDVALDIEDALRQREW